MACRVHHDRERGSHQQLKAAPPQHTRPLTHAQSMCDPAAPPQLPGQEMIIAPSSAETSPGGLECHRPTAGTVKPAERGGEQEHSAPVRVLINDCCAQVSSSLFLLPGIIPVYIQRETQKYKRLYRLTE